MFPESYLLRAHCFFFGNKSNLPPELVKESNMPPQTTKLDILPLSTFKTGQITHWMVFTAPLFSFLSTAVAGPYQGEFSSTTSGSYPLLVLSTTQPGPPRRSSSPPPSPVPSRHRTPLSCRRRFLSTKERPCPTVVGSSRRTL